ncbi:carboxymuconolactone decarboxylase family protein [Streptomyces somaliensis DSM 40738]|uniref:carboxymuconolactone decarboxylase family protein n=1 Tax=Streptomyces somaliensis TaxID=78355 RepID=UPI0021C3D1E6|nr:carboxymuconolactone decarboxylase family protein [Streptomyces somaliensis]MCQ0025163.1 carboxymuconolactone decarboxylase family protein [Streptomyces somaliensis DSM 40738]
MRTGTRFERGLALPGEVSGARGAAVVVDALTDVAPDPGRFVVEWAYAGLLDRPGPDLRERELATVGALAALGGTAPRLNFHIDAALQVGVTPVEIVEALVHPVPFTGFPHAPNAIRTAREVLEKRNLSVEQQSGTAVAACPWEHGHKTWSALFPVREHRMADRFVNAAPIEGSNSP